MLGYLSAFLRAGAFLALAGMAGFLLNLKANDSARLIWSQTIVREDACMQYRQLGSSGLKVSELALGSWLTYGAGVAKDQALACVKKALELGINLIDTANVYGHGAAESFLGEALAGVSRDSYVLATKLFFPMTATDRGLSAAQVKKQLDASLKRLRTDHVDLYQCHRYDPETPLEETMTALTEAVEQGK